MSSKPYLNQVYKEIKEECLRSGRLFKDDKFPPCDKSINFKKSSKSTKTKWIRAINLVKDPQFIIDGISRDDLDQGNLGDCWFIAAIAAITEIPEYRQKVIPDDQSFGKDYCGIFHFRFWQKGLWVDVVVDDYLPVDENNQLIYLSNSKRKNEFWCQLLEKAYAKLYYCYDLLDGGMEEDSLIDMTGGVAEIFDLNKIVKSLKSSNASNHNIRVLWKLINQSFKMGSVANASIWSKEANTREVVQDDGLIDGHAYTVSGMDEKLKIIRIRNPHGHDGSEWNGAWSDKSSKWNSIDNEIKKRLNFVKKNDGEFWMSFDDFIKKFDRLTLVHINLNAFTQQLSESNETHSHWDLKQIFGKWKAKTNEIKNYQKHFWSNPQHVVNLTDGNARQMIIALMSLDYNDRRKKNEEYASLTFHLFKVISNKANLKVKYDSSELERVGKSDKYDGEREVSKRFYVKKGVYVIVPSIVDRSVETKYLLRVFTESVMGGDLEDDDEEEEFEDDEDDDDDDEDDDDDDDEDDEEDEEDDDDEDDDEEDE